MDNLSLFYGTFFKFHEFLNKTHGKLANLFANPIKNLFTFL